MKSDRIDRYQAAVLLAQLILEQPADTDQFLVQQAIDDVRDEVAAGRRNQAEFPSHFRRVVDLFGHSIKTPSLKVVK